MSESPSSECGYSGALPICSQMDSVVIKIEPEFKEAEPLENKEKIQQNSGQEGIPSGCRPPTFTPVYCQLCRNGPFADTHSLQHHTVSAHSTNNLPKTRQNSIEEEKYSAMDESIAASFNAEDVDQSDEQCLSQFTCQQCQAPFQTLVQFINHMRIKHLAATKTLDVLPKRVHCPVCKKEFAGVEKKTEHMVQHFISTTSTYYCHCASTFATAHQVQQHFIASHTQMLYRCGVCLQLFTDNVGYQRHTAEHIHEKVFYNCVICDIGFKSMDLLCGHIQLVHDKQDDLQSTYNSNECQQTVANPDTSTTNASRASIGNNYEHPHEKSDVSYKHFSKKQNFLHNTQKRLYLKSRYQRRLSERRNGFKCQICDAVFSSQPLLYSHHSRVHEVSLLKQKASNVVENPNYLFVQS